MFEKKVNDKKESTNASQSRKKHFGMRWGVDSKSVVFIPRSKLFVPCDVVLGWW